MVFHEARGYARSRTKPLPSPPPILSPPFSCFEFGRECDSWFIRFSDWWARRVECQEMTKIIIIRGATLVRETISPACRVYSIVFLYICVCIRDIDGHPFDINWTRNHCPVPRSHPWSPNWQNPNSLVSPIKIRPGNIVIHPPLHAAWYRACCLRRVSPTRFTIISRSPHRCPFFSSVSVYVSLFSVPFRCKKINAVQMYVEIVFNFVYQ